MTFRDFLRERGVEPGERIFKYGYEDFDGEKLYLDGRYTLEELRLTVAFMERQDQETTRAVIDAGVNFIRAHRKADG